VKKKSVCHVIVYCFILTALFLTFFQTVAQSADDPERSPVPWVGDFGELPVSDETARFEAKLKSFTAGQSREAVRQELGDPIRRSAVYLVGPSKDELPVDFRTAEFGHNCRLEDWDTAEMEAWFYAFEVGEKHYVTTTITNCWSDGSDAKPHTTLVRDLRRYTLYFVGDALVQVKAHN